MHKLSKYALSAALSVVISGTAALWVINQQALSQPHVAKKPAAYSEAMTLAQSELRAIRKKNPMPASRTFYRWVDADGSTGYGHQLPAQVQEYKAIVLDGSENIISYGKSP